MILGDVTITHNLLNMKESWSYRETEKGKEREMSICSLEHGASKTRKTSEAKSQFSPWRLKTKQNFSQHFIPPELQDLCYFLIQYNRRLCEQAEAALGNSCLAGKFTAVTFSKRWYEVGYQASRGCAASAALLSLGHCEKWQTLKAQLGSA